MVQRIIIIQNIQTKHQYNILQAIKRFISIFRKQQHVPIKQRFEILSNPQSFDTQLSFINNKDSDDSDIYASENDGG